MTAKPDVSVIIPTYNQELYIARCLRSIIGQSFDEKKYEIILINDKSTDKTKKILNIFKEKIKIINNKKRFGLPKSINIGIKKSTGKYVVRLDSDDYVNRDFLKILYLYMSHNPEIDAVSSDYYLVNDKEIILEKKNSLKSPIACGIMFKIDQLIEIGLYDEKFFVREDKDLRYRFLKKFKITRIPLPLYRYRRHKNNITNNKVMMKKHLKKFKEKYKI